MWTRRTLRAMLLAVMGAPLVLETPASGQPSLSHVMPAAVRPGREIELTLRGKKLTGPLRIWTSFPARAEWLPAGDPQSEESDATNTRRCRVSVDADVPPGIGGLMVANSGGVSDVALLMIDELPTEFDKGQNHALHTAQLLVVPTAVDAVLDGARFDYYRFSAAAGERVACEVVGTRLASEVDPVVRLLDSGGEELLLVDDDLCHGADCRFQYRFERAGDYYLELRDNRYRAGGRCRLRLGDFPLVSVAYPLGGRLGSTTRFQFAGPAADGAAPVLLELPEGLVDSRIAIAARYPEGRCSSMVTLAATRLPEQLEIEPNDRPPDATPVTLPCAVNGRFEEDKDRDYFAFPVLAGQSFVFRAMARSLGSPSLAFLKLFDGDGGELARSDVGDRDELTLRHTFSEAGVHCLMIEDLLRRGGPEHGYRVEVERGPDFQLSVKNEKNVSGRYLAAKNGGAFRCRLLITRHGHDGPIELAWRRPAPNLILLGKSIPAKAKEHEILVAVTGDPEPGMLLTPRLVGRAKVAGRVVTRNVDTERLLRDKWPQLAFPPAWLNGLIAVAVGPSAEAAFDVDLKRVADAASAKGETAWIATLRRRDKEFQGPLRIELLGLPDQFSYSVQRDEDRYHISVKRPDNLAGVKFASELVAFGEWKNRGMVVRRELESGE